MKNIVTLALLLSLAAILPSCSDDSSTAPRETASGADQAAPESAGATSDDAAGKYNFRVPVWGMTMDEVINVEGTKPKNRTDSVLNYETFVAGHGAFIDYQFSGGKLVRASLIFPEVKADNNDYIREYRDIKDKFSKQYGQPVIDSSKSLTGEDIPNAEKGDAVCGGRLVYGAEWSLPGTTARLVLNSYRSQCTLVMMYTPSGMSNGL